MTKKIINSFIPYLGLLIGIFIIVIILDAYAEKISDKPIVINISAVSSEDLNNIVQFETDEDSSSLFENEIWSDSLFVNAVNLYKKRDYNLAKELFQQLEFKYQENSSLDNYIGLILLKEKRFTDAREYFLKATSIDPQFFAAYINLAVVSSRMHQFRNAESAYRRAIEIKPFSPKPHYNLGLMFFQIEDWENASIELLRSIELSSGAQKAKGICYYGVASLNLRDTSKAKLSFNKAIEYKPDYQLPRIYLSLISPDIESRESELSKVYRLNPNSYYANYYLGKLYVESNRLSKAEYHLQKALEINPDDEIIIEELSSFLISQQRYDEAQTIIAGFAVNDTLPQSYFHEARLVSKKGNIDEAILLYNIAQQKSGNDYPKAALNAAILYKQKNDYEKAIKSYEKAIEIKPDYAIAYYNLALLYQEKGDIQKAIANYTYAIQYDPHSSKSWYNLALIYENQNEYDTAVNAFKNAIKIEPDYLKALSSLGILYARLNQFDKAIETYHLLLKHYPDYSRGYYNLALAYSKIKQYEQAISAYSKVIEINPENIKAKINIGVLYARTENIELAIKTFEDASDMDVDNPEIRFNLALQYERAKKYSEAIYQYSMAAQLDNDYTKAYDKLIHLYKELGDSTNYFIVSFKKMKQDPDAEELYDMGKKLYKVDAYNFALDAFNMTIEMGAKREWSIYWKGMIYMKQEKLDDAVQYFSEVLKADPDHKFALYRIGQTFELKGIPDKAVNYYDRLLNLDPGFKIVHKKKLNITKKKSHVKEEKG